VALLVMLVSLVFFWVVGAPLGYGLIASGCFYLILTGTNLSEAAGSMVGGITENYVVLAVPLFIFTSYLMNSSGMTDRLFRFAQLLLGRSRGALAQVNVVATLVFSGMTGSAVADTAGIGVMSVRAMETAGYPKGFACATTITSSIMGPLLPPSIPIVIYGFLSNTSIGTLFMAGVVPAVALAVAHMVQIGYMARHRGFPRDEWRGWLTIVVAFVAGLPAIAAPAILIVGIYTGIFTPSESSAVAVLYTLLVAVLVYRSLSWDGFKRCLAGAVRQTGAVTALIAGAFVIDYGVTASQLPVRVSNVVLSLTHSSLALVLLATALVLVLGLMLEVIVLEFVVLPILVPILADAHVNMIYYGVVFTFATMIALGMPTLGTLNFVLSNLTRTPLEEIIRAMWPFLALLVGGLFILIFVPELSLWLPRLLHMPTG
jgi:tripartite ATP-independent transporter DctM subunit